MQKYVKIISLILSIVLSVSIMALIINIILKQNVFNEAYHKNLVNKEGLYKEIEDRVEEKLKLITTASNFPETLYQNIVTDDMINVNVDKILEENIKALNNQDYDQNVINIDDLLNTYYKRIDDYIASRNVIMNDSAIIVINDIKLRARVEVLGAISSINFWTFLENHKDSKYLNLLLRALQFLDTNTVMLSIVILTMIVGLFALNLKRLMFFFKYAGVALFIGGAIPFCIGLGGNLSDISNKILFMGTFANKLLCALIDSVFNFLTVSGIILIIVGVLAIIVSALTSLRRVSRSLRSKTV